MADTTNPEGLPEVGQIILVTPLRGSRYAMRVDQILNRGWRYVTGRQVRLSDGTLMHTDKGVSLNSVQTWSTL